MPPADPTPSTSEARAPLPRDIGAVRVDDLPPRDLPAGVGGRLPRYQVVVKQSVLNQIHRHGLSTQEVEVCGVLVGNVYRDAGGAPFGYVEAAIEGNHATGRSTQVTFTPDTWTHIQTTMDREHASRKILGWYHTHPGFGIFLSEMDQFICTNFFPEPWHIALVYDPRAAEEGVFVWRNERPTVDPLLVEPDAPADPATAIVARAKDVSGKGPPGADVAALATRLDAIEKRQKVLVFLIALTLLIAIAWPLAMQAFLPNLFKHSEAVPAGGTPGGGLPMDPAKKQSLLD